MYCHGWICRPYVFARESDKNLDVGVYNHSGYIRIEFAFHTTKTTKQLIEGLGEK